MLNRRGGCKIFYKVSTWIVRWFRVGLTSSIWIMMIFISMIIIILLLCTNDSMLSIMLIRWNETFKLLFRIMSINCSWFKVFRRLWWIWYNFWRILHVNFSLLFKCSRTVCLFNLFCCFPFIFGKHDVLIVHRSELFINYFIKAI
jgi:hypothetical protein